MNFSLQSILAEWLPKRDDCEWVLGTVYKTEGSSYRKAGAMMLFSSDGDQLGLLSGGCLESDIFYHAKKTMYNKKPQILCYDGNDEDDISFQLGIGCGGTVYIILQPVVSTNNYLELDKVYLALKNKKHVVYEQLISNADEKPICTFRVVDKAKETFHDTVSHLKSKFGQKWLVSDLNPQPHLMICGGGYDARPLASIAKQLGWEVSLWDPRPANARREHFLSVDTILDPSVNMENFIVQQRVNAIIIMTHSLRHDAQALKSIIKTNAQYIGLLGPLHRKKEVLALASLEHSIYAREVNGPIGINIGGRLPESVALSILTECHQKLFLKEEPSNLNQKSFALI